MGLEHRTGRRRFSEAEENILASAYIGGSSIVRLAKDFGCTYPTVAKVLRRMDLLRPAHERQREVPLTEEEKAQIVSLYNGGESVWAIKIGLRLSSTHPVELALRRAGIKIERRIAAGPAHHAWKGGVNVHGAGYRRIKVRKSDPLRCMAASNGYVMEHRLVMARSLGRPLRRDESVHHVNGDRLDNRIENLQLVQGQHGNGSLYRCRCCGSYDIEPVPISKPAP